MSPKRLLLLCHDGGWERLYQAGSCAATAASMGWRVDVVFYFGALRKLVDGELESFTLEPRDREREERLRDRAEEIGTRGPAALFSAARRGPDTHLLACSASLGLLGLQPESVLAHVDEVVGWPTTVALMGSADQVLYF